MIAVRKALRSSHAITHKGYVQVCATAPEMAPASSFRVALGFCSPSGVKYFRTDSYTMKLRPTWVLVSMVKVTGVRVYVTYIGRDTSYGWDDASV